MWKAAERRRGESSKVECSQAPDKAWSPLISACLCSPTQIYTHVNPVRLKEKTKQRGISLAGTNQVQRRTIQKLVENPVSSAILHGEFSEGDTIVVDAEEDGEIGLRKG